MKRYFFLLPVLALLAACTTPPRPDTAASAPPASRVAVQPPAPVPPPRADMANSQVGKAEVMKVLVDAMKPWWSPEQQGVMLSLGYYSAAAAMCDTLQLDKVKVDALVRAQFLPPQKGPRGQGPRGKGPATPHELGFRKDVFLMHLGMVTGAVMGSHRADIPGFCADAAALKVKVPGASNLFKTE
ncbi:MAG: hypothetical protein EOP78_10425 [Variovorax sp.]|nr:MAG: hypothetical protein EOP78_10425 [Variovorax sp.]